MTAELRGVDHNGHYPSPLPEPGDTAGWIEYGRQLGRAEAMIERYIAEAETVPGRLDAILARLDALEAAQ